MRSGTEFFLSLSQSNFNSIKHFWTWNYILIWSFCLRNHYCIIYVASVEIYYESLISDFLKSTGSVTAWDIPWFKKTKTKTSWDGWRQSQGIILGSFNAKFKYFPYLNAHFSGGFCQAWEPWKNTSLRASLLAVNLYLLSELRPLALTGYLQWAAAEGRLFLSPLAPRILLLPGELPTLPRREKVKLALILISRWTLGQGWLWSKCLF